METNNNSISNEKKYQIVFFENQLVRYGHVSRVYTREQLIAIAPKIIDQLIKGCDGPQFAKCISADDKENLLSF